LIKLCTCIMLRPSEPSKLCTLYINLFGNTDIAVFKLRYFFPFSRKHTKVFSLLFLLGATITMKGKLAITFSQNFLLFFKSRICLVEGGSLSNFLLKSSFLFFFSLKVTLLSDVIVVVNVNLSLCLKS
jgi:hypothetical protein